MPGHCKKLEPEFAKAATALKDHDPPIALAKLDATEKENEELKSKFEIRGFPTLKIFKNGKADTPVEYQGPRDADGIVKHLKKQVLPATVLAKSKDDVKTATDASDILVLGYFDNLDTKEFKAFTAVADALRSDLDFVYASDASVLDGHCTKDCKSPYVMVVKKSEKIQPQYEGEMTEDLLKAWVESNSAPLVAKFSQDPTEMKHFQKAFGSKLPKLITLVKEADEVKAKELLSEAATANSDMKFIFTNDDVGSRVMEYFGITADKVPALLIVDDDKAEKFLQTNTTLDKIPEFIKEYKDGVLKPFLKSEETPKDNSGPVTVVTGNTFDEIVFGKENVFIEFYAPWCGHCKTLAPTWEELGAKYKDNKEVIIAKMDGTANDIPTPKIKVSGFPTLVWVDSAGEVEVYRGGREMKDLSKFVAEKIGSVETVKDEADEEEEDGHDEL